MHLRVWRAPSVYSEGWLAEFSLKCLDRGKGEAHHARWGAAPLRRALEQGQQLRHQGEVAEVVGLERLLDTWLGLGVGLGLGLGLGLALGLALGLGLGLGLGLALGLG